MDADGGAYDRNEADHAVDGVAVERTFLPEVVSGLEALDRMIHRSHTGHEGGHEIPCALLEVVLEGRNAGIEFFGVHGDVFIQLIGLRRRHIIATYVAACRTVVLGHVIEVIPVATTLFCCHFTLAVPNEIIAALNAPSDAGIDVTILREGVGFSVPVTATAAGTTRAA